MEMTIMIILICVLVFALMLYALGFWSTHIYPAICPFRYQSSPDVYIPEARKTSLHATMASQYQLYKLIDGTVSDVEKIQSLTAWVHQLWLPHSSNSARSENPLVIISRAQKGEQFSRKDYSTVLVHALMAIDIPTRKITLCTRDCAYRPTRSQYNGIEYFDRDHGKWVWLDEQYGVRLVQGHEPLNVMEIKDAILNHHVIDICKNHHNIDTEQYLAQLTPFLDVLIAQPMGQNRSFALVPPQLKFGKKKWGVGRKLYDVRCHSLISFYPGQTIKKSVVSQPAPRSTGQNSCEGA
ncbi:MAG: hypothetical protein P8X79_01335 [Reinekea sp.]